MVEPELLNCGTGEFFLFLESDGEEHHLSKVEGVVGERHFGVAKYCVAFFLGVDVLEI